MHVGDYADDFAHRRFALNRPIWSDSFANRIFARKILFSETFGYNRDRRRIFVVAFGEGAAKRDRGAKGLEIFRSNDVDLRDRLLAFGQWPLLHIEGQSDFATAERYPPGRGGGLHTWKNGNSLEQFLVKLRRVQRFRITFVR